MQVLIVTGGIATGKSAFCRAWLELAPGTVFHDADAEVHALYAHPDVREELAAAFGSAVLVGDTDVDRAMLRQEVFHSPEKRKKLEGILHPRVRSTCLAEHTRAAEQGAPWFLADIPLFFEAGCWKPDPAARVIVVACTRDTQLARLRERNPLDNELARRIVASQADLGAKMAAADHVIWNEGQPSCLKRQIRLLLDGLLS